MSKQSDKTVLVIDKAGSSALSERLGDDFVLSRVGTVSEALEIPEEHFLLVLLDASSDETEYLTACKDLKESNVFGEVPVILYVSGTAQIDTRVVYDAGMDDVILATIPDQDLKARLEKSIFHTIANRQLKSRLHQANEMAFSAMADTSDLGVNIQFLVHCHECNNLDELGMLLFSSVSHYQINCSLQFRSEFETKNLEENGLTKDLEARLLTELSESGRYVDFGRRTIMNYGQVSLLVKNMPVDSKRYGTIKDNVFSLLQGADARVKAIDNSRMLEMERDVLRGIAHKIQGVMAQVDNRYQSVMKNCATLVEDMSMKVDESIMFLDLTEAQEDTFSDIMQTGVVAVNRLFSDGLRIDESFRKLIDYLNNNSALKEHSSAAELKRLLDRL